MRGAYLHNWMIGVRLHRGHCRGHPPANLHTLSDTGVTSAQVTVSIGRGYLDTCDGCIMKRDLAMERKYGTPLRLSSLEG